MIRILKKIKRYIANATLGSRRTLKLKFAKTLNVSLGENCLTDNILQRHHIKSFSTVYSHSRSNMDYAIQLEEENYAKLLVKDYLYFDTIEETVVVRNKHYSDQSNIYSDLHNNGFEFTHHDVINNSSHAESIKRKIERLNKYKGRKNYSFFYHYRLNPNSSLDMICQKADTFLKHYAINGKKCELIIFTQNIISDASQRGIKEISYNANIRAFILNTLHLWSGNDQDIFWARNDDDLLAEMLKTINSQ